MAKKNDDTTAKTNESAATESSAGEQATTEQATTEQATTNVAMTDEPFVLVFYGGPDAALPAISIGGIGYLTRDAEEGVRARASVAKEAMNTKRGLRIEELK